MSLRKLSFAVLALVGASACQQTDDPAFSYYEERVGPVLTNGCARGPSGGGCHLPREDGTALGNLDVSSYDSLMRRDDVLAPYGPYSVGLLLLKAGRQVDVQVETWDPDQRLVGITTDIRHNNGATIDLGSSAYAQLKQWIEAGYTRSGVQDDTLAVNEGDCVRGAGEHPLYDPAFADRFPGAYATFRDEVQPVLVETCAGSSCHGSTIADLYLSCGDGDEETRWNFWVALQHATSPISTSGLLRRPLSTYRGGVFHEGGNIFASAEDEHYQLIRGWLEQIEDDEPEAIAPPSEVSDGLRYFANRVQPMMVRKGCMFLNCHSPSMFHELRLQGGAQGHFSTIATYRNWEASRLLLALDATTPNESRIVAKNLYPPEQVAGMPGSFHRGGSLFEDFGMAGDGTPNGATPDDCDGYDLDAGDLNEVPGYCIMLRWWEIERQEAIDAGEIFDPAVEVVRSVVWVRRPAGVGEPRDFDTYRPGADLLMAPASVDADDRIGLGAASSVLGGCGLDPSTADVRGPAVSWDGERIAFSARSSESEPLRLYWMASDGTGCEPVPGVAPAEDRVNGILTHDFDPAFAPDGRLIFASTRGNLDPSILGDEFAGPTRTPAAMQPNANLYIQDADGSLRQLTFLLNQEFQPSFMADGRLIFTAEKREPDFHQLAGRRQNLDGGDYHPLFAQRASVGYRSATEIVELLDRNLAMVASPLDAADGAGRIVVVNRSIGPDQDDRARGDRYYISSQRFLSRVPGDGRTGVYRSPYPLPSGRMLVSCDEDAASFDAGGFDYALCEMNASTGRRRVLTDPGGMADVEAVAVYGRAAREVFESKIAEVNGTTHVVPDATDAQVDVLDFPLLATLLFENTREGRDIDYDVGGIDVFAEYPPPTSATGFGDVGDGVVSDDFGMMYLDRRMLGHVDLAPDGSGAFRYPGGLPIVLGVTGWDGSMLTFDEDAPFSGEIIQREQMQFYPGERIRQSFRRELFNGMCGGCHGSITNRELDVAVQVDVLTSASQVQAMESDPVSLGL
ncbi:MAG TPA: hypothetical protein RMH99_31005 [Sandaracinaceae bacterium LLY-WYZ-13_1]|nr:hypothetical protein [Sandaracinaceae bacterium LLY-WYZ-13_1]